MNNELTTLTSLYEHFDQLVMADADSDLLFASSYVRGFIALSACEFGDEGQVLSKALADSISVKLDDAKNELTPPDRSLVKNYWLTLQSHFIY